MVCRSCRSFSAKGTWFIQAWVAETWKEHEKGNLHLHAKLIHLHTDFVFVVFVVFDETMKQNYAQSTSNPRDVNWAQFVIYAYLILFWGFPKMMVPNNHVFSYKKWSFRGVLGVKPPFKERVVYDLPTNKAWLLSPVFLFAGLWQRTLFDRGGGRFHLKWVSQKGDVSHEKKPCTFHYTGWLIGILTMVHYNPYIIG